MIAFVAASRGVFSSSAKTMTWAVPSAARAGDVLIAILGGNAADDVSTTPAGWTLVSIHGSGADRFQYHARMVAADDLASHTFALATVAQEWLGELVALRETAPGVVVELTAATTFSSATVLPTPGIVSQQAVNLILATVTCTGTPTLTPPSGFTAIDSFAGTARSMMVSRRIAGITGASSFPNAAASVATTGAASVLSLRSGPPITPAELFDLVPGNIGLVGRGA